MATIGYVESVLMEDWLKDYAALEHWNKYCIWRGCRTQWGPADVEIPRRPCAVLSFSTPSSILGRCSALRMRMPTTGSPGPCATPSATGASAGGTRRRSPSLRASGDAGDGRAPPAQAMSAGGWGWNSAAERPPSRARPP